MYIWKSFWNWSQFHPQKVQSKHYYVFWSQMSENRSSAHFFTVVSRVRGLCATVFVFYSIFFQVTLAIFLCTNAYVLDCG